jgi:methyl-accepting chemotaxis protein
MTGWLANRAVRTKVLLVVAILGVAALAGSGVATMRLHELKTEAEALYVRGLLPVAELSEVRDDVAAVRVAALHHAITSDAAQKTAHEQEVTAASDKFAANLAAYRAASGVPARICADDLARVSTDPQQIVSRFQLVQRCCPDGAASFVTMVRSR